MVKEFRNLGHITAFAVFVAVLCVYIPETLIARVDKKCDKKNGKYDCDKKPMLESLRKGIDAEQLLKCIDPFGRGGQGNAVGKPYTSVLEKQLNDCSGVCVTNSATCAGDPKCNDGISDIMKTNPLYAFNPEQLLDFNVFDHCSAPVYLGGKMDRSRPANPNAKCEFLGVEYMASGANCALLKRHHGLGISAVVLGGVWGLITLIAYVAYYYSQENSFSLSVLGNAESGIIRIVFHVYSAITIGVMSFYVLSALDWGMRMTSCESPVPLYPDTSFASSLPDKDTFVGDAGTVTTNEIGVKYNITDSMIPFLQVASEFVNDAQNDTSFIKWTDLYYTDNPIHGLRNSTDSNSVTGLCPGGIGHQLNAEPGSFWRDSTGVSSTAFSNLLRIATALMLFPLALSLGLQTYASFHDWMNPSSGKGRPALGEGANGMLYWATRLIVSLLVAVFFYVLGAHWMDGGWNDDRCGEQAGFDVASLGSSKGNGKYHYKTQAMASAFAMAALATLTTIESVLQIIQRDAGNTKLRDFLISGQYTLLSTLIIFATFVFFIYELGAIIGENASDLCDPHLNDNEQKAVTAGLLIVQSIICMFALLYAYAGAMPEEAAQRGLAQSMSYFQMKPMAQITESFL